ncbi:hypothetical protein Hanom_Chr03g00190201 [Helianthus anomalus]
MLSQKPDLHCICCRCPCWWWLLHPMLHCFPGKRLIHTNHISPKQLIQTKFLSPRTISQQPFLVNICIPLVPRYPSRVGP